MMVVTYPDINPIAFHLKSFALHWYAIMYFIGFGTAWGLALYRIKKYALNWTHDEVSDLMFYAILGVILGGRLGYMLFYDFSYALSHPLQVFKIWQGGMSFHGGFIGVMFGLFYFSRRYPKHSFLATMDFMAPLVPLGLAAGRLGNFINGELWGRPTHMPDWGMIFPYVDNQPRHPSQLYECGLEGFVLFTLIWLYASKPRAVGQISAVFLLGYGLFRFILEFFREPDLQLGFLFSNWLTMGQLLSIPMILLGLYFLIKTHKSAT